MADSGQALAWSFLGLWIFCFIKTFLLKNLKTNVCVFGERWKTSISNFATKQTKKFDRNRWFLLVFWMYKYEQVIGWENYRFIGALFNGSKIFKFFKVSIVLRGTIFTDAVTKELKQTQSQTCIWTGITQAVWLLSRHFSYFPIRCLFLEWIKQTSCRKNKVAKTQTLFTN